MASGQVAFQRRSTGFPLSSPGANDLMKVKDAPAGGEVRDGYSQSSASMSLLKSKVLSSPPSLANCNITFEAVQGEYPL